MTFGDRLLKCMKEKSLTQKDLSEMIDASPTQLNYWVKNKRQPDIPYIRSLAKALNVSADFLIGNAEHAKEESKPLSEAALAFAALYDSLTDEGRELLNTIAKFAEKHHKV